MVLSEMSQQQLDELKFATHIPSQVLLRIHFNHFGDPLTFQVTLSSGQNVFKLVYNKIPAKLMAFPFSLSCTLCVVLISKW